MLLAGKKALILGIANDRSLAYSIAKLFKASGASIALTYMNEAIQKRVEPIAEELGADFTAPMDVSQDEHFPQLVNKVKEEWGEFDILVHSLAFAQSEDLKGNFIDTSRKGFQTALEISAYSLVSLSRSLRELMRPEGSVITLSYHGAQKVTPNYNIMGVAKAALEASVRYLANDLGPQSIRINAISAGPVKTLAASAVGNFRSILSHVEERSPMHRNITGEDVAGMALYLASSHSQGVTGQVLYVDSGFSIMAP